VDVFDEPYGQYVSAPAVCSDPDGSYLVVFELNGNTTGSPFARRFGPDDQPLGPVFSLNGADVPSVTPAVRCLPDGKLFELWIADLGVYGGSSLKGRYFAPDGSALGGEISLSDQPGLFPWDDVDCSAAGCVVGWRQEEAGSSDFSVFFREVGPTGALVTAQTPLVLDPHLIAPEPEVAINDQGRFAVGLFDREGDEASVQHFSPSGAPEGPKTPLRSHLPDQAVGYGIPDLAIDPAGDVFAVWYERADQGGSRAYAAVVDSTNDLVRPRFRLDEISDLGETPQVFVDTAGSFILLWLDESNQVKNISGRAFAATGQPLEPQVVLETPVVSSSAFERAFDGSPQTDGNLLLAWLEEDPYTGRGNLVVGRLRSAAPTPPAGPWLRSSGVPGFEFKVQISGGGTEIAGALAPGCIPQTACVSGALPGRSEVFLRIVGPKPNGFLWPTLVKFSTSQVEVWVRQIAGGTVRYYKLEGARPGYDELPGLFDRYGFLPADASRAENAGDPPPPGGPVFTSPEYPDFRFQVQITAGAQVQDVRQEPACIGETLCFSGAIPGRSEVFVRIVGPKPNGKLWPTIVKFTTSTVEVWIQQISTGDTKYYRIEGAAPDKDDLTGLFDRNGFTP
jgi:hypothetical protein